MITMGRCGRKNHYFCAFAGIEQVFAEPSGKGIQDLRHQSCCLDQVAAGARDFARRFRLNEVLHAAGDWMERHAGGAYHCREIFKSSDCNAMPCSLETTTECYARLNIPAGT